MKGFHAYVALDLQLLVPAQLGNYKALEQHQHCLHHHEQPRRVTLLHQINEVGNWNFPELRFVATVTTGGRVKFVPHV